MKKTKQKKDIKMEPGMIFRDSRGSNIIHYLLLHPTFQTSYGDFLGFRVYTLERDRYSNFFNTFFLNDCELVE